MVDIEGLLNYYNEDYVLLSDVMTPLDRMRKEVEYITQILGLTPGMKVLDLGCGYGRIAQELATAGMHVTGVDLVPAMIDKAKERAAAAGLAIDYRLGDFSRLPSLGRFDAVIMWFFSFGYGDETAHLKSLRNACAALRKGGLLLFDQYNTHVLAAENHPTMVDRGDTLFIHKPRPDLEVRIYGVCRRRTTQSMSGATPTANGQRAPTRLAHSRVDGLRGHVDRHKGRIHCPVPQRDQRLICGATIPTLQRRQIFK